MRVLRPACLRSPCLEPNAQRTTPDARRQTSLDGTKYQCPMYASPRLASCYLPTWFLLRGPRRDISTLPRPAAGRWTLGAGRDNTASRSCSNSPLDGVCHAIPRHNALQRISRPVTNSRESGTLEPWLSDSTRTWSPQKREEPAGQVIRTVGTVKGPPRRDVKALMLPTEDDPHPL